MVSCLYLSVFLNFCVGRYTVSKKVLYNAADITRKEVEAGPKPSNYCDEDEGFRGAGGGGGGKYY